MSNDLNLHENIVIKWKDGKASIIGDGQVKAVMEISSSELRKMYFGGEGSGVLHLQIVDILD